MDIPAVPFTFYRGGFTSNPEDLLRHDPANACPVVRMPLGGNVMIVTSEPDVKAVLGRSAFGLAGVPSECAPSGALF